MQCQRVAGTGHRGRGRSKAHGVPVSHAAGQGVDRTGLEGIASAQCAHDIHLVGLKPFDRPAAPLAWYGLESGRWVKHQVSDHSFGHGIGAGDINRDGRADILTPRGDSEELAERIPNSELVVISGAAHGLMVEHASTFNRLLLDFLGRCVRAERRDATSPVKLVPTSAVAS